FRRAEAGALHAREALLARLAGDAGVAEVRAGLQAAADVVVHRLGREERDVRGGDEHEPGAGALAEGEAEVLFHAAVRTDAEVGCVTWMRVRTASAPRRAAPGMRQLNSQPARKVRGPHASLSGWRAESPTHPRPAAHNRAGSISTPPTRSSTYPADRAPSGA